MSGVEKDRAKRRRRVRWVYITVVVLVAVAVVARIWWGHHAEGKLQEILAEIAARGEPIRWSELAPPSVPEGRNAALLYEEAWEIPLLAAKDPYEDDMLGFMPGGARKPPDPKQAKLFRLNSMIGDLLRYPEFRRQHSREMMEIAALSEEVRKLCREARELEEVGWELDFSIPPDDLLIPACSEQRALAPLVCLGALSSHYAGKDGEAVECVRDVIAIADSVAAQPCIVPHLVAIAIDGLAIETLERIVPEMKIGGQDGAATADQVRGLIRHLLATGKRQEGLVQAFIADRILTYENCETVRRTGDVEALHGPSVMGPILKASVGPLLTFDECRVLRHCDAYVTASREKNFPQTRTIVVAKMAEVSRLYPDDTGNDISCDHRYRTMLSRLYAPSYTKMFALHYWNIAHRRMAAVAAAIRLYQVDHGRWPRRLSELVGRYLPSLPIDPFDPAGKPIRYLPASSPPILYCLNSDTRDDHGELRMHEGGESVDPDGPDLPFFLDGDRPVGESEWEEPGKSRPKRRSMKRSGRRRRARKRPQTRPAGESPSSQRATHE